MKYQRWWQYQGIPLWSCCTQIGFCFVGIWNSFLQTCNDKLQVIPSSWLWDCWQAWKQNDPSKHVDGWLASAFIPSFLNPYESLPFCLKSFVEWLSVFPGSHARLPIFVRSLKYFETNVSDHQAKWWKHLHWTVLSFHHRYKLHQWSFEETKKYLVCIWNWFITFNSYCFTLHHITIFISKRVYM